MLITQYLHDRAGTFASLLYKDEMLSVCPHFFRHARSSVVSQRIDARLTRNEAHALGEH